MKDKYKAAIIGCGQIGCSYDDDPKRKVISSHAGAYQNNSHTKLVALVDTDTKKIATYSQKYLVNGYTNYLEMLNKETPEIISICTTTSTHSKIVQEIVNSNSSIKAILCEKPLASTSKEAQAMIDICAQKNILLLVNYSRRFDLTHREIKKFLEAGKLGEIQQVSAYYVKGLANSGSHLLDLLRFFFGETEWVQSNLSKNKSSLENDVNSDGLIKFKTGILCSFQSLDVNYYWIFELRIYGTKGLLEIKDSGYTFKYYTPKESSYFSGFKELQEEKLPFIEHSKEMMINAIDNIVNCLEQQDIPWCEGKEGMKVLNLIEALHTSSKEGGRKIYV